MTTPAFPLLTMVTPALQGVLKIGFGEAVVVHDMPNSCKFLSLNSFQKRFLWTHKGTVIGLLVQVGDAEKFPQALDFGGLNPFLRVSKQGPCFTAIEEDGGDRRLVLVELEHCGWFQITWVQSN